MLTDFQGNRYGWRGALIFPDEYFGAASPSTGVKVYVGANVITAAYIGATAVDKIYVGANQVYP